MPKNIDEVAQQRRRREAWRSAIVISALLLLPAILVLFLRWHYQIRGIWSFVMLAYSVLELGMILPVWILLKKRLTEIEGGEEDAATEY